MFSRHTVNSEFRDWFNVLTTTCNDGRKSNIEQVFYAAAQRWEVVYTHFLWMNCPLIFQAVENAVRQSR